MMARGRHAGSSEAKLLQTLLEACGQCEEVPEAHMDIHTGLSGSGVAFVSVISSPTPQASPWRSGDFPSLFKDSAGLWDSRTRLRGCL